MKISEFIPQIKATSVSLIAGAGALAGIFNFKSIVPEPIESFEIFGPMVLIVFLILSFIFLKGITKRLKPIIIILCLNLAALFVFQTIFITKVHYSDKHHTFVFHGLEIKNPELQNYTSHEDIIKDYGKEYDSLKEAYENFTLWILLYQLILGAFIALFVMSISGVSNISFKKFSQ